MQRVKAKEISKILDEEFLKHFLIEDVKIEIDNELDIRRKMLREVLVNELDDFLSLFDDGIKLVLHIQKVCELIHHKTMNGFSLVLLSTKIVTLLLGIRQLIYSGMSDATKPLNRTFTDTIDLFFACIKDGELSRKYAKKDEMYDNNEFYWRNISKKIIKIVVELLKELNTPEDRIIYFTDRRKTRTEFFSNSIHASYDSSFTNYFSYNLNGEIEIGEMFGKVTSAYPNLIFGLLEDINILNQVIELSIANNLFSIEDILGTKEHLTYLHYQKKFETLFLEYSSELSEVGRNITNGFKEAYKVARKQEGFDE